MKSFLVLLFALVSVAQAATTYTARGSPGGTAFTDTVSFVATPAYTSYTLAVQSAVTLNSAGHLKWAVLPSAPVLTDSAGNIIPTTWTHVRKAVTPTGEATNRGIDLDSYVSNSIFGLAPGTTYYFTVPGTGYDPDGGDVSYFVHLAAE